MTLASYLPPKNICPISVSPLVPATITSCALFPSPLNSHPCLIPYKLPLQTEEQLSIVLGTDSNNDHLSSSYMSCTCHVLTHSILKSALGGRHYYPHTASNNDIETLRHRGVVNITQARGGWVGIQALVCEHPHFNIHAPVAMGPAFLKSKLSKPAVSLSIPCLSLQLHTFIPTSHLPPPTSSAQMTLSFSQFLKPSALSLTAKYLHMFSLLPEMLILLSFYLINSYHCLSSSTKSFRLFWPHLIPRCLHSLLPHP